MGYQPTGFIHLPSRDTCRGKDFSSPVWSRDYQSIDAGADAPVQFSPETIAVVTELMDNPDLLGYPNYLKPMYIVSRKDDDSLKKTIIRHLKRFSLRLDTYARNFPNSQLSPDYIFSMCISFGPEFAKKLKEMRQVSMLMTLSIRPTRDTLQWAKDIELWFHHRVKISDHTSYDDIYHEQYLFPWQEKADDFIWSFEPKTISGEGRESFRRAARSLLNEIEIREDLQPGPENFKSWISDSITRGDNGEMAINRNLMRNKAREGSLVDLIEESKSRPFTFYRKSVFVSPANARDTWQCDLTTLFKVKRIAHILRPILDKIKYSAMCSPEKAYHRRKRVLKEDGNFYMFDYKKCGLTVERELLVILGEELDRRFPGQGFSELCHWETVNVFQGEVLRHPVRGVGLGNCNEGITLIQCVIGRILEDLTDMDSVFFNDDGVVCGKSGNERREFGVILTVLNRVGMIVNLKKTLISDCNVFCEDYIINREDVDYSKSQNVIIPFVECFFSRNIVQAKSHHAALQEGLRGRPYTVNIVGSLIERWGYEFHFSEGFWPSEFGGWIRYGDTNINECLRTLVDPDVIRIPDRGPIPLYREWAAYQIYYEDISENLRRSKISYRGEPVLNPFVGREEMTPQSEWAKGVCKRVGIRLTEDVEESFHSLFNLRGLKNAKPHIKAGLYDKLYSQRRRIWRKFRNFRKKFDIPKVTPTILSIVRAVIVLRRGDHTPQNYFPPTSLFRHWIDIPYGRRIPLGRVASWGLSSGGYNRFGAVQTLESIRDGYLKVGAQPLALRCCLKAKSSGKILSTSTLYDVDGSYHFPPWIYHFFASQEMARVAFIRITNRIPVIDSSDNWVSRDFELMYDPVKMIFPDQSKRYWDVLSRAKQLGIEKCVSEIMSRRAIRTSSFLCRVLSEVEQFMRYFEVQPEIIDDDRGQVVGEENFLDYDNELIDDILGLKDFFDLVLDDEDGYYGDDHLSDGSPEFLNFDDFEEEDYLESVEDPTRSYFSSLVPRDGLEGY